MISSNTLVRVSAPLLAALIVLLGHRPGTSQDVEVVADPEVAELVVADLVHFRESLEALERHNVVTAPDSAAVIQELYLDRATPGLTAWVENFRIDALELAGTITRYPRFYDSLRDLEIRVLDLEAEIREAYARWTEIHPDAVFPPVYFFAGGLRAGGLAREVGLLIGADLYSQVPETPLEEFERPERIRELERLPHLVSHELAHYQQFTAQGLDRYRALYRDGGRSLLGIAIREGSADFLAELTSGGHINPAAHAYGARHEAELWEKFRREMHGEDGGEWLFVRPENGEWPQDLGYYFGYRITEHFFEGAENPMAAVQAILRVSDFRRFLERSGYPRAGGE